MKSLFIGMLLVSFAVSTLHAQDTSSSKQIAVQLDSTSLAKKLEGTYSAALPSNPGNFSAAKLIFKNGVPQMFVDEMQVAIREYTYSKDYVLLKVEIEGEPVSLRVLPIQDGIQGIASYEDMKFPFLAKKEIK